ncbi:MAG: hypothetical protein EP329_12015, partial [Deltaproteobacteria bacterium]
MALVGGLCVPLPAHADVPGLAGTEREIVFIIDGTATMGGACFEYGLPGYTGPDSPIAVECDPTDLFELQKVGVIRAVQSVPIDGSYAVSVVYNWLGQPSLGPSGETTWPGPQVMVARTVLDSLEARIDVINQVQAIAQGAVSPCGLLPPGSSGVAACADFSASPGWGLLLALGQLAEASPGASREVCFTGDQIYKGPPMASKPEAPEEAFDFRQTVIDARNSGLLDRINVANVFSAAALANIDFERFSPQLRAQLVKEGDWLEERWRPIIAGRGGFTQVADRHELAMAIVGQCVTKPVDIVGIEVNQVVQDLSNSVPILRDKPTVVRVYVESDNPEGDPAELLLRAIDPATGAAFGRLHGEIAPLFARPAALQRRDDVTSSQVFVLPEDWLARDAFQLSVQQIGVSHEHCLDASGTCTVDVAPQPVPSLPAHVTLYRFPDEPDGEPGNGQAFDIIARIEQLAPMAELDITRVARKEVAHPELLPPFASIAAQLEYLEALFLQSNTARLSRCLAGNCEGMELSVFAIPASRGTPVGSIGAPGLAVIQSEDGDAEAGLHEFTHALNVGHSEGCGAEVEENSLYEGWPHVVYMPDGKQPAIGSITDGANAEIWGVDTLALDFGPDDLPRSPYRYFDYMSYCLPHWMSRDHYEWLLDFAIPTFALDPDVSSGAFTYFLSAPHLFVSGTLHADGTADLGPAYRHDDYPSNATAINRGTGYRLETSDLTGHPLDTVELGPTSTPEGLMALGDAGVPFAAAIPWSDAVYRLTLYDADGQQLAYLPRTATPFVTLQTPQAGDTLAGDREVVTWEELDSEGAPLFAALDYSPDGGETWQFVARDVVGGAYDLDLTDLAATDQGVLRVRVSDGLMTRVATVGPLIIPPRAPFLRIESPADGARFAGKRAMTLRARARRPGAGALDDGAIAWTSDVDGPLGTGRRLSLMASWLTPGTHVLTARATDGGPAATASVTIEVASDLDDAPPPGPDLEIAVTPSDPVFRSTTPNTLTVSVGNGGNESTTGAVSVGYTVPAGLVLASASGAGWDCGVAGAALECTHAGAVVPGATLADLVVAVDLDPGLTSSQAVWATNVFAVATVGDVQTVNDRATARVSLRTQDFVDLAVSVERTGATIAGGLVTYAIAVDNVGAAPVSGDLTVTQTFPAGVTVEEAGGDGWDCVVTGQAVTCTWVGGELPAGAPAPAITIEVLVEVGTGLTLLQTAPAVSHPLDGEAANDVALDTAEVHQVAAAGPDLRVILSSAAELWEGGRARIDVDVVNDGVLATDGEHTVDVTLPSDLAFAFASGRSYTCVPVGGAVSCTYVGAPLGSRELAPRLSLFVDLSPDVATLPTVHAVVSTDGDVDPTNDDAELLVLVYAAPSTADLVVVATPSATAVTQGEAVDLEIRVRNVGGQQNPGSFVKVELGSPYGVMFDDVGGTGWTCKTGLPVVTCTLVAAPIPSGGETPPFTATVRAGLVGPEVMLRARLLSGESSINASYTNDTPPIPLQLRPGEPTDALWVSAAPYGVDRRGLYLRSAPELAARAQIQVPGSHANSPAPSADGRWVAFVVNTPGVYGGDLWLATADGATTTPLAATSGVDETEPSFSPDGRTVVYSAATPYPSSSHLIRTVGVDGTGAALLPTLEGDVWSPRFTPSGGIAYARFWEEPPASPELDWTWGEEIVIANADGSAPVRHEALMENLAGFDFAPDGTRIAVRATLDGVAGIHLLDATPVGGAAPVLLAAATNDFPLGVPRWSPDGAWIACDSDTHTYLISPDTGAVAPTGLEGTAPAWASRAFRPTAVDDAAVVTVGDAVTIDVLANDVAASGQGLGFSDADAPRGGSLSCTPGGRCTYTADGRFVGQDAFRYFAVAGDQVLAPAVVAVDVRMPPPELSIDAPQDGAGVEVGAPLPVAGTARLRMASDAANVVVVVDLSQVATSVALDCDGDGSVTAADDVNADGRNNYLDCYMTAGRAALAQLAGRSDVDVAIVVTEQNYPLDSLYRDAAYTPNVRVVDSSPEPGLQAFTGIDADRDGSGKADVLEAFDSIVHGGGSHCTEARGATEFTATAPMQCRAASGEKSDDDVLLALDALLAEQPGGERSAVWWFAAQGNASGTASGDPVWGLIGRGTEVHAYSGTAYGCTTSALPYGETALRRLSWVTGGSCQVLFGAVTDAEARLPGLWAWGLASVTVGRASDPPVGATFSGPERYAAEVTGIVPGANRIRATAVSTDGWTVVREITVYGQEGYNTAPIALPDALVVAPPAGGVVAVLANDVDADGDVLALGAVSEPAHGTVRCSPEGACAYVPGPGFTTDVFTYQAVDGRGGASVGTVFVVAAQTNAPPVAPDQLLALPEGGEATIDVAAAASDPEGGPVTFVSATAAGHGEVSCTAAGVCTYVAGPAFGVSDVFAYTVGDDQGAESTGVVVVARDLPPPDVALTASLSAPLSPGGQGVITATLTHGSGDVLPYATVKLVLPPHFAFVAAAGDGWSCEPRLAGRLTTCQSFVSSVAPSTYPALRVTVAADAGASGTAEGVVDASLISDLTADNIVVLPLLAPSPCEGVTCSGRGTCAEDGGGYVCECEAGYTGDACETNIDDCVGVTCSGHGTCVDGVASYTCDCQTGYTGDACETNVDDCVGVTCSGHGTCVDGVASYTCDCQTGYSGDACETNVDDCVGVTCSG